MSHSVAASASLNHSTKMVNFRLTFVGNDPSNQHDDVRKGLYRKLLYWLVVWNMNFIFPYLGKFIIPTDSYFSGGVGIPPTSLYYFPLRVAILRVTVDLGDGMSEATPPSGPSGSGLYIPNFRIVKACEPLKKLLIFKDALI